MLIVLCFSCLFSVHSFFFSTYFFSSPNFFLSLSSSTATAIASSYSDFLSCRDWQPILNFIALVCWYVVNFVVFFLFVIFPVSILYVSNSNVIEYVKTFWIWNSAKPKRNYRIKTKNSFTCEKNYAFCIYWVKNLNLNVFCKQWTCSLLLQTDRQNWLSAYTAHSL